MLPPEIVYKIVESDRLRVLRELKLGFARRTAEGGRPTKDLATRNPGNSARQGYCPLGHLLESKCDLSCSSAVDFVGLIPPSHVEFGQGASVICYAITPSAIVQLS